MAGLGHPFGFVGGGSAPGSEITEDAAEGRRALRRGSALGRAAGAVAAGAVVEGVPSPAAEAEPVPVARGVFSGET